CPWGAFAPVAGRVGLAPAAAAVMLSVDEAATGFTTPKSWLACEPSWCSCISPKSKAAASATAALAAPSVNAIPVILMCPSLLDARDRLGLPRRPRRSDDLELLVLGQAYDVLVTRPLGEGEERVEPCAHVRQMNAEGRAISSASRTDARARTHAQPPPRSEERR